MGNCVQSSSGGSGTGGGGEGVGRPVVQLRLQRRRASEKEVQMMEAEQGGRTPPPQPSVVKVKMVLTKGELGWLVARLNAGDRRLEDVLHEMARTKQTQKREGRGGVDGGWRPSLESIVESPAELDS